MLFAAVRIIAQDLVANGSFEDVNFCLEYKARCSPAAWFFVSQKEARGYYSLNHLAGTVGTKYLSLDIARYNVETRQYWETVLLCDLAAGAKYRIQVNLKDEQEPPDPADIGLNFCNRPVFSTDDTLLRPSRFVSLSDGRVKKLKDGWVQVEKEFTADSNFKYLIIGNFSAEANRAILQRKGLTGKVSVLIDDLRVLPVGSQGCGQYEVVKDSLYAVKARHDHLPKPDMAKGVTVALVSPKIDTVVISNVLFQFNSYSLASEDILDKYEKQLTASDVRQILVAGYTDSVGNLLYNQELSRRRADAVGLLLRKRYGVPAAKIGTEGRGKSTDYAEQEKNRRVELYIYH